MSPPCITPPDNHLTQPPTKVIFTLGIFFDGTANNAHNTTSHLEACVAAQANHRGSHLGYYTNIHWLNTLYKTDLTAAEGVLQQSLYIDGIGTQAGEQDRLLDSAFGTGERGVLAKTEKAIRAVATQLQSFFAERPDAASCIVSDVQFDLFGFSRGAASARHFANRVFNQDCALTAALKEGLNGVQYQGAAVGKVRFLGLFDTVAAISSAINGFNPNSADTGNVNLMLRPGVAERVFHLTAQHECRFNFALNSVKPAWPELALPGAHADIGGGYHPLDEEDYFLTRPQFVTVPLETDDQQTDAWRQASEEFTALRRYPASELLIANNPTQLVSWHDERMSTDHYGTMQKRSAAAVVLRCCVRNDWAKVALRVMMDAATEAGVLFMPPEPTIAELALPGDLESLCEKAIALGRSVRRGQEAPGFTTPELNLLASRYLHCSANWNDVHTDKDGKIVGAVKPASVVSFVNRPDRDWQRTVYTVDGRKAGA
ncbi:DUF2235 domain-containing protein [Erwinia tracheiphila]|nr:DUF2235 domain-containing protein [Erwinia tracheiphila]EOS94389.1 hypothetical protein ETR_14026 [Erwinia tracheiphila PSU-1]UIA83650.1 DUF2235 domain-containing protein [Erwinia tracheiphila]UIA88046.1 DUF2235 domain-containing protein [Erwinia tracheiphila]UIA92232.1 DUF2235 domain-containing protein [Erwinia tracheiphila]UIA96639.1 DUF2235 domain-containing protein [Erwinia tracheiphila]